MPRSFPVAVFLAIILLAGRADAQVTGNPFPAHINADDDIFVVDVEEFAELPETDGSPPRMMRLIDEPVSGRLFVNDMYGKIYTVSHDGSEVRLYLDLAEYGVDVESGGRERGFQNFALHPDFAHPDAPGYGRFYTYSDVTDTSPAAHVTAGGGDVSHHTVLHEWTASDAGSAAYDGDAPAEMIRFAQPFGNHNAGHLAFNPLAEPGETDYGMLYVGVADGGSGGDPMNLAQNLQNAFGKLLRIDPLGSNGANGRYGIPPDNPFAGDEGVLDEIFAYGMRNPQRFGWDPTNGNLILADIGQNTIEKVTLVPRGANLGWNEWEGSYRFVGRDGVNAANPRSDADVTYPLIEWSHEDPLTTGRSAATGAHVFRGDLYPRMQDRVLVGDFVSGELFHFDADDLPDGGNDEIRRVLLRPPGGEPQTFLEIIRAKNEVQGRTPTARTDVRIDADAGGHVYLLNKHDGVIRRLVPQK